MSADPLCRIRRKLGFSRRIQLLLFLVSLSSPTPHTRNFRLELKFQYPLGALNYWWTITTIQFGAKPPCSWLGSSVTNVPKAISSLVLLDIYWTHKWYISVFPKTDLLNFSAAPPFFPVPCNESLTGFKLVITNATWLWVGRISNYVNTSIVIQLVRWDIK